MQWMKDRDLLIEETLAFARSVAPHAPTAIETQAQVEPIKTVALEQPPRPKDKLFEREEIKQRVADFSATQNRFQREREEYFKKTLGKATNVHGDDA